MAAYCRVSSSSDEQLGSYYAQVDYYSRYIQSRPDYTLVDIFADKGISGTDINKRVAFHRLMQVARTGQLDMIITKSLSRFGRNTLDCLKNIRELKALGVDVFFEKENIHTLHSDGELLLSLISAIAQNESFNQSENVKWGIRRQYERGHIHSIPSGKFLGYKKDEKGNLVIDDAQAAVVRRIYQAFLDGFGTYQIAKVLTKEQVPMAFGGKEWCLSHIQKVLTNEKYQGDTRFQKTYNADYLTKRRAKNNGELPQYYLQDTHPPIIDRLTWSLVQLEFERQKQFVDAHYMDKYHYASSEYPLSGKIFCHECGHAMVMRESKRRVDLGQNYWVCKRYKAGRYRPAGPDACCNWQRIHNEQINSLLIEAWNDLVDRSWQLSEHGLGELESFRTNELICLVAEFRHLALIPYELLLKVLDHIEVGQNGELTVAFLAGTSYSSYETDLRSDLKVTTSAANFSSVFESENHFAIR